MIAEARVSLMILGKSCATKRFDEPATALSDAVRRRLTTVRLISASAVAGCRQSVACWLGGTYLLPLDCTSWGFRNCGRYC